jgi:beta-glucanase (GH16 family)
VNKRQLVLKAWVPALFALSLPLCGNPSTDVAVSPFQSAFLDRPATGPVPLSDPHNNGCWTLYEPMSDEFTGATLDHSKWKTAITGWAGRPPALIVDHNVEVRHGALRITMRKEAVSTQEAKQGFHDYTTGAVQSTSNVLYGYFEVRAKAMQSGGSSAFWFPAKDETNWNEIDVFEAGGRRPADPRRVFMSGHVFEEDGITVNRNSTTSARMKLDVADGFHVYGMHWTPDFIDFYIDGRLQRHMENTSWHTPTVMILDAETQVDWWGMPLASDLPSVYSVDYVRAWKQYTKGVTSDARASR